MRRTNVEGVRQRRRGAGPGQSRWRSPSTAGGTVPSTCPSRLRIGTPGPRGAPGTHAAPTVPWPGRRHRRAAGAGRGRRSWGWSRDLQEQVATAPPVLERSIGRRQRSERVRRAARTRSTTAPADAHRYGEAAVTRASLGSRSVRGPRPDVRRSMSLVQTVSSRARCGCRPGTRSRATRLACAGGGRGCRPGAPCGTLRAGERRAGSGRGRRVAGAAAARAPTTGRGGQLVVIPAPASPRAVPCAGRDGGRPAGAHEPRGGVRRHPRYPRTSAPARRRRRRRHCRQGDRGGGCGSQGPSAGPLEHHVVAAGCRTWRPPAGIGEAARLGASGSGPRRSWWSSSSTAGPPRCCHR